jgi:hypothetical protein
MQVSQCFAVSCVCVAPSDLSDSLSKIDDMGMNASRIAQPYQIRARTSASNIQIPAKTFPPHNSHQHHHHYNSRYCLSASHSLQPAIQTLSLIDNSLVYHSLPLPQLFDSPRHRSRILCFSIDPP